jgi:hypothetical protein
MWRIEGGKPGCGLLGGQARWISVPPRGFLFWSSHSLAFSLEIGHFLVVVEVVVDARANWNHLFSYVTPERLQVADQSVVASW